jgi:hypothetical protein
MKGPLTNIIAVLALFMLTSPRLPAQTFHKIPAQKINLYTLFGDSSQKNDTSTTAIEISDLITYEEYKKYLSATKKDSSASFYLSQFPDTNISIQRNVYLKYINSPVYNKFPVLGISWDNAMNYCKWKTLRDNDKDTITFIYRLPDCLEWLSAYNYLKIYYGRNDYNDKYSDWLLNSKIEASFRLGGQQLFPYDIVYFHTHEEPLVYKRKFVIGNSFHYEKEKLIDYYEFSYYASQGYPQVAFRIIKEPITDPKSYQVGHRIIETTIKYWDLNK